MELTWVENDRIVDKVGLIKILEQSNFFQLQDSTGKSRAQWICYCSSIERTPRENEAAAEQKINTKQALRLASSAKMNNGKSKSTRAEL